MRLAMICITSGIKGMQGFQNGFYLVKYLINDIEFLTIPCKIGTRPKDSINIDGLTKTEKPDWDGT